MIKVSVDDLERIKACLTKVHKELESMEEFEDDLNKYVPEEVFLTDEVFTTLELVEELLYEDDEGHYSEDWEPNDFD